MQLGSLWYSHGTSSTDFLGRWLLIIRNHQPSSSVEVGKSSESVVSPKSLTELWRFKKLRSLRTPIATMTTFVMYPRNRYAGCDASVIPPSEQQAVASTSPSSTDEVNPRSVTPTNAPVQTFEMRRSPSKSKLFLIKHTWVEGGSSIDKSRFEANLLLALTYSIRLKDEGIVGATIGELE